MTKILDIKQSIITANGNVSLAKELFAMLLEDLGSRLLEIENNFKNKNFDALTENIHKLYGATAYCIVPKLRKCTAILEKHLKQKDYTQLDEQVAHVLEEIQNLIISGPDYIKDDWDSLSANK